MEKVNENDDDSFLRWRMSIEEEEGNIVEEDEITGEPLLKTVVRTSYLYHLRQSLRKNLETSKQQNLDVIEENIVNKVIKGCSALLEEKALRNCMIARLYQRMMAHTIKEVKKATTDGLLYLPLKDFADRQSKVPIVHFAEKEIQTELNSIQFASEIADLYNQTQTLLQKMSSETISSYVKENNDSSLIPAERLNNSKVEKEFKNLNGVQRVGNSCVTCHKETMQLNCSHSPDQAKEPILEDSFHDNQIDFQTEPIGCNDVDRISVKRKAENDCINLLPTNFVNSISNENHLVVKRDCDQNVEPVPNVAANKFDSFQTKLRSPNFVECVAFWYHLECEIEELPPLKKQKLDEKFAELFGKDHAIDYYFLTDEQKSITCRKRIAKHVVVELTNYYIKKKIASKQLFKTMAKHITSILLGRSLYPDPMEIKKSVEEFFIEGRVINSEDDFYV